MHGISLECPVIHGRSLQVFLLLYREEPEDQEI